MQENHEDLKLANLIDIDLLQELQDTFANTMGFASIAVDDEGPITKPSNFTDFCIKYTRGSKEGCKRCNECDIKWGKLAAQSGKPVIYDCHSGLTDFAVPIVVEGKHIASILGGQVLTKEPDIEKFKSYAKELSIDEKEYLEALKKIKIVPQEIVDSAVSFLYLVANAISKIAAKNLELIKIGKREDLLRKITEKIRSSLDVDDILSFICEETAKLFNVQRTAVAIFPDYVNFERSFVRKEYKQSPEMLGFADMSALEEVAKYWGRNLFSNYKTLPYGDIENSDAPEFFKESYKQIGVKSIIGVAIRREGNLWGALVLSDYNSTRIWSEEEQELLSTIADQVYIAINQAEMFENERKIAKREITLRENIKKIRSSLNKNEIKNYFLNAACEYFNADRCLFVDYDQEKNEFLPFDIEILKDNNFKSLKGINVEENFPEFSKRVKSGKNVIISDLEKILSRKDFLNYKSIKTLRESEVKSDYALPVTYDKQLMGAFLLQFLQNKRILSAEEIEFLRIIKDNVAIALYQADSYQKIKEHAEVETALREIIEKMRNTLDVKEILFFICEEAAKLFNVQRTAVAKFKNPKRLEEFNIIEYKTSPDISGFESLPNAEASANFWKNCLDLNQILALDNVQESNVPDYFKETYKDTGVKSIIGASIKSGDDVMGTLILSEYNEHRIWSDKEKKLLITIADQVYFAINQAELFANVQKKAQNEMTLREIMLAASTTLDMEFVLKTVVSKAGELFKADRCFFVELDSEKLSVMLLNDYAIYLSSAEIVSPTLHMPTKAEIEVFILQMKDNNLIYSSDVKNEYLPHATKKMLVEDLSVKSYLQVPVFYADKFYGAIVFHYVNEHKQFLSEDLDMAKAIANQTGVILHNAELYKITKIQAEREKISKNIIEILRSTFNKSTIKNLFVKNISKFFDADRVIFSDYDAAKKKYMPVAETSQYLSSSDFSSLVGFDWSAPQARSYINIVVEGKELLIYDWQEYINENLLEKDFINLFEGFGIKSCYTFPVMYQQTNLGFISIHFTKNVIKLTNEDVNRIRNICTQAGIAIYHADLYEKAQKSVIEHNIFVNRLSNELKEPLDMIIEFSGMKSEHEFECMDEVVHLKNVNQNAKKLLYLIDDIIDNSKIDRGFS